MNLFERRRGLIKSAVGGLVKLIVTAASGIVSFVTNVAMPTKITCEFSPVQSGTGDPSPSNVRPISGWTGCNISSSTGNLLLPPVDGYYPTFIRKGTKVTVSCKDSGVNLRAYYYRKDKTQIDYYTLTNVVAGRRNRTFTLPEDIYYFSFSSTVEDTTVRVGTDEYDYAPYANTLPVNWTNDVGTIYGGTLTINEDGTGTLVKTYHYIDVNPNSASLNADKDTYVWAQISLESGYYATANSDQSVSNIFKGGNYAGTTWQARTSATGNRIIVSMPIDYNTTEKIREFFTNNPTQFAYPLATPATYNLTASQVNSIIGTNNIWHDMNGSITVEYYNKQ